MELYAADVQLAMAEGHDLSLIGDCCDFETVGQTFARDHPRVITPDGDVTRDAAEDGVVGDDMARGSHAVEHVAEVL